MKQKGSNLDAIKTRVQSLIRQALPKSDYSVTEINKVLNLVKRVNENNLDAAIFRIEKLVQQKQEQIKKNLIKKAIKKFGQLKRVKVESGKVKSKRRLDAAGVEFFRTAERVLKAIATKNELALTNIENELFDIKDGIVVGLNPTLDNTMEKLVNGQDLTLKERQLVDLYEIYTSFPNARS